MLKHDPRDQRTPRRPHRVIVATATATGLKRRDDLAVGKNLEHQPKPLEVRQAFDIPPGKGSLSAVPIMVFRPCWGLWNKGRRP